MCCIAVNGNNECVSDRDKCDAALEEAVQTLIKYATIGGIVAIVCSLLGLVFCCLKKKMTISNRRRGESVIEVKNGAFQPLDESNYQAPAL